PPTGPDPRQRPTRLRLLPPRCPGCALARLCAVRAHARGRTHLCDHLFRGAQPLLPLRVAADASGVGSDSSARTVTQTLSWSAARPVGKYGIVIAVGSYVL